MKIDVQVNIALLLTTGEVVKLAIHGKLESPDRPRRGDQILYPYGEDHGAPHYEQLIYLVVMESYYATGQRTGTIVPVIVLGDLDNDDPDKGELIPITHLNELKLTFLGLWVLLGDLSFCPQICWGQEDAPWEPLHVDMDRLPDKVRLGLKAE